MRKRLSPSLMIVALALLACSKDDEAPNYEFVIAVDPGYFAHDADAWIILHDKAGNAIGESQLVDGQTTKLKVSAKKIGVTLVRVGTNVSTNLPSFQLESFLNVDAAASWSFKKTSSSTSCGLALGNIEIIVSDPGIGNNMCGVFGSKGSILLPDASTSTPASMRFPPITMYAGCNNVFLYVMDKNRVPRYKMLENVNPGQYAYTFSDLKNFDQVIDVNYKETSYCILSVAAVDANQSVYDAGYCTNFNLGDYVKSVSSSSIKIGYLSRFPKYVTTLMLSYPGYAMSYTEAGGVPSAITMPETLTATITDKTLGGYTFSVNEPIVYRQVSFSYYPLTNAGESGMSWQINSPPENDFKNITALPTQFITKYPQFKIENLKYNSSSFFKENQTIDAIVSQRFGNAARPESYKTVYKTFYN
jgi:hypothetical protein